MSTKTRSPWQLSVVAGLSTCLGWFLCHALQSGVGTAAAQNAAADPKPAAAVAPAADEGDAKDHAALSPLEELAWLTGDWVEDSENPALEFNCRWTRTGAFLIRAFRVQTGSDAAESLSGMQIVGWDPKLHAVRSWTFDSTGGFGEETWSRLENRWSIRSRYTLADGGVAAAIHVMTRVDDDSFHWKSIHREIDGVLHPDTDEVVLVRAAAGTVAEASEAVPAAPAAPTGVKLPRPTKAPAPAEKKKN